MPHTHTYYKHYTYKNKNINQNPHGVTTEICFHTTLQHDGIITVKLLHSPHPLLGLATATCKLRYFDLFITNADSVGQSGYHVRVRLFVRSITQKTKDPKVFKLGIRNGLGIS